MTSFNSEKAKSMEELREAAQEIRARLAEGSVGFGDTVKFSAELACRLVADVQSLHAPEELSAFIAAALLATVDCVTEVQPAEKRREFLEMTNAVRTILRSGMTAVTFRMPHVGEDVTDAEENAEGGDE